MTTAIWGLGSVGIGLASALASAAPLTLIGRNAETRAALTVNGIRRTGLFGEVQIDPDSFQVTDDPSCLQDAPPDWLLHMRKILGYGNRRRSASGPLPARRRNPEHRYPHLPERLGQRTGSAAFLASATDFSCANHHRFPPPRTHEAEITALAAPNALGGIACETCADMRAELWAKMLYNCALIRLGLSPAEDMKIWRAYCGG